MTKKILIVEDEKDIVELLSAIFDDLGDCEVLCARDGQEALSIAQVNTPDIILLDIQIPRVNGYDVCRAVKSDPSMSKTKVLMLTGLAQNHDCHRAQEAGADAYLTKPFHSIALIEKVEELLSSS